MHCSNRQPTQTKPHQNNKFGIPNQWMYENVAPSRVHACDHTVFTHSSAWLVHSHHKPLRQDVCLCSVVIASPSPTTTKTHFIIIMALKTRKMSLLVRTQTLFAIRIDCVLQDHFRPLTSDHNANAIERQSCKTRRIIHHRMKWNDNNKWNEEKE